MILNQLIVKKRKEIDMSQTILALELGISNDYLCKVEKGEKILSKVRLNDISRILKIDINLLEELWLIDKILFLIKEEDRSDKIKELLINEYRKYI